MAFAVKPILSYVPPNLSNPGLRGLRTLADFGKHLQSLGDDTFHLFSKIMTMSAADFLEEWFECEPLKALGSLSGMKSRAP